MGSGRILARRTLCLTTLVLSRLVRSSCFSDGRQSVAVGDAVVVHCPSGYSGPTAAVSIRELCRSKPLDIGLVTAASGGTRSIEVQLLKKCGCKYVAGTCSTPEKAEFLRSNWSDQVIYKKPGEELAAGMC